MKCATPLTIVAVAILSFTPTSSSGAEAPANIALSQNKKTVQTYMEGFKKTDHVLILSCLTDDVEWVIPGMFHTTGKAAFDEKIEDDAFEGSPKISVTRMTEENSIVVAEGTVQAKRKDGGILNLVFCDVFEMKDAKIKRLTSYLMEVKD